MEEKYQKFTEILGAEKVKLKEPLSGHTTFRIGGPADLFFEAREEAELIKAIEAAIQLQIPYFILGNGSNILFSDEGFRGLVIQNLLSGMAIKGKYEGKGIEQETSARHIDADPQKYLSFSDLDYPDEPFDCIVEVYAGTLLQNFIQLTLENNLTGLQWFSGIPASVGGAIVNNIHGGKKIFSNYIDKVVVINKEGKVEELSKEQIGFDYDFSNLLKEKLIVIKADLLLSHGDVEKAKYVYDEWWKRKRQVQPQINCPGSIFKNMTEEEAKRIGAPTTAAGWLIDQCGLKGAAIGGAQIYEKHANFIINLGEAKAKEVLELIVLAKSKVKEKFGIRLVEEIALIGFDNIQKF